MLEEDFLKEKQNIRQKMLKFSRAINQGKPLDDELREEISSDDILRRRFKKKSKHILENLDEEYETRNDKKSNIYLKEDLINVKLEEKQSLAKKILLKIKEKKKSLPQQNKKTKKIFSFIKKKDTNQNTTQDIILSKKDKIQAPSLAPESKLVTKEIKNIQVANEKENFNKISQSAPQPDIKQSLENLQKKITIQEEVQTEIKKPITQKIKINDEEDSQKVKNVLLDEFSNATKEDRNLNFNHLLFAALLVSFALFLFIPQIYIRNQIYYLSREIATLKAEESVLDEENKDLKRHLENMRFQNQILDYLE